MAGRIGKRAFLAGAALFFAVASLWLLLPERYLAVSDGESGRAYHLREVEDGSTVRLSWTHSVERTPWVEVYEVSGEGFELREARVKSFGAGVDAVAPEVETRAGWVILRGTGRSFPELRFLNSGRADRELRLDGRLLELDGRIPEYAPVEVEVREAPRVLAWLQGPRAGRR